MGRDEAIGRYVGGIRATGRAPDKTLGDDGYRTCWMGRGCASGSGGGAGFCSSLRSHDAIGDAEICFGTPSEMRYAWFLCNAGSQRPLRLPAGYFIAIK
jgi:hypothetical protein